MQPSGAFNRQEIYVGGRHLATYDSKTGATYFIHDDWQGTERVRSSYAGGSYETCTNLPYGDQQTCTGATDPSPLHYTGKMRDVETTLDYFGARYYSSGMGHWMSPDWADKPTSVPYANFGDPQSLNLYAMVTGNPVSKQDSDGHKLMDFLIGHGNAGGNTFEGDSDVDSMLGTFAAPTKSQQPQKSGGFWQKLKNAFEGNGWKTNQQVAAGKGTPTVTVTQTFHLATPTANQLQQIGPITAMWMFLDPESLEDGSFDAAEQMDTEFAASRSLASEEQTGELASGSGQPIMGAGTGRPLSDTTTQRLVSEYGGEPGDWQKVTSSHYSPPGSSGATSGFEIHAYQNVKTGQVVEMKTKFQ